MFSTRARMSAPVDVFDHIPASILFNATSGSNTLHFRSETNGFNANINWGDGTSSSVPVNGGNVTHNYSTAGNKTITISGEKFSGFNVNQATGKEKYIKLNSMGKWKNDNITTMDSAFRGCNNFYFDFNNSDAFKYNTNITTFRFAFSGTNVSTIPVDLFKHNVLVNSFVSAFSSCASLNNVPADLFRYNVNNTTFAATFSGCSSLTSVPANIFRYNTEVTSFQSVLSNCQLLNSIQADLFRYNTKVTSFYNAFYDCIRLPLRSDMFGTDYANRFKDKTVSFTDCFRLNAGVYYGAQKGDAPALWSFDFGTGTPNKSRCFYGHSTNSVNNYADIPADWRT